MTGLSGTAGRIAVAMGAVFVDAASLVDSSFDPSEIAIDLIPRAQGADEGSETVWISEQSPGGNGVVESLYAKVAESSVELRRLISVVAERSDLELLDDELRELILGQDPVVSAAIKTLRDSWALGHDAAGKAISGIRVAVRAAHQINLTRQATSFLATRVDSGFPVWTLCPSSSGSSSGGIGSRSNAASLWIAAHSESPVRTMPRLTAMSDWTGIPIQAAADEL